MLGDAGKYLGILVWEGNDGRNGMALGPRLGGLD